MYKVFFINISILACFINTNCLLKNNALAAKNNQIEKDILLIINFNHHQLINNIDFLMSIYKQHFPHINFYAQKTNKIFDFKEHKNENVDLEFFDQAFGHLSYKAIAMAMKKNPNYTGYLFIHDDCLINFWNLKRLDKGKIWVSPTIQLKMPTNALTWPYTDGKALRYLYAKLYDSNYSNNLNHNCSRDYFKVTFGDFCYIPSKFVAEYIDLVDNFFTHTDSSICIEASIGTLVSCLDKKENYDYLNGINIDFPDRLDTEKTVSYYNSKIDYIHPFKFSNKIIRDFVSLNFKELS